MLPQHLTPDVRPKASGDAIVHAGRARFTVLTERLIRLEYSPDGRFEDRASQTIWFRQQPIPAFEVRRVGGQLIIETSALTLNWTEGQPFTAESLSIHVKPTDTDWHPGDVDTRNLKGTTRTLDAANGYVPLKDGLMSPSGWALLDDSQTLVLNDQGWLEPRTGSTTDWYFFAYGHDYKAGLRDYCAVSGQIPMIPRWILGNWWSRFWAYTQEEFVTLINDFKAHEIPLSVCIVDMDWHITKTGNTSIGWTGYTWNRDLFPDPQGLINFFHANGLRTAMNLHPADGIHPHEVQYPEMARRMGIDPTSQQPIPFDIADPAFVRPYFEVLHHPYEDMGVDFWWLDWQQGQTCKLPGLDPLWLINHLHFQDAGRDRAKRPFIFSRWGSEGHQRYPIGFSGDSYMTWDTLRFESYMTATASNVAYGWWSHDIGGHTSGTGDAELFTRWIQFAVFSPILRIHSTKGYFYDQRPWMFADAEVRNVLRDAMQLRHALIPYIYSMAWRAHRESLPLMLPMYYDHPEREAAYACPQQYMFGSELIAAPFVDPADRDTGLSRQVVWLPPGEWYDFFSGEHHPGDRWVAVYGALKDMPLFAKAGAIVPMGPLPAWDGIDTPSELNLHVFAGADNTFTLYEDDGTSREYESGAYATTTITQHWTPQQLDLTVDPAQGQVDLLPAERTITLIFHGVKASLDIAVVVDGQAVSPNATYDDATETLTLHDLVITPTQSLSARLSVSGDALLSRRNRKRDHLLTMARTFKVNSGVRNRLAELVDMLIEKPDELAPYVVAMKDSQVRAVCEMLYDAGVHAVEDVQNPVQLIVWNNRHDDAITYRYSEAYLEFGFMGQTRAEHGTAPAFKPLTPNIRTWRHGAVDEHVQRTQWLLQMDYHGLASARVCYQEDTP